MHQPVAIWWTSGWKQLNPNMLWFVVRRLDKQDTDLPQQAITFWRLYLESNDHGGILDREYGWFDFKSMIRTEGWSNASLRFFERVSQPHVEFGRHSFGQTYPVEEEWTDLPLRRVVDAKVRVLDRHNDELNIPDEHLARAISIVRRSMLTATFLLDEIGTQWWQMPTLHPTGDRGETFYGRKTLYFLWFRDLFVRLIAVNPEAAALEVKQWPINDKYFFGKLSIFASMHQQVMSANSVANLLLSMDDEIFWESRCQRELLFTLRARWPEFKSRQRRAIERRIAKGPAKWSNEKASDFRRRRAVYSAERLTWLELNGCPLTPATTKRLAALKGVDPSWSDDWARSADRSLDSRGGWVERVTETRGIESVALSEIVNAARDKTESRHGELRDYRPFEGLVASQPFRALAALRFALRKGDIPIDFWKALLSDWPDETSLRLRWLVAETIKGLSSDTLIALRFYVPRWFQKHLASLAEANCARALTIFDKIAAVYAATDPEFTESGIGQTTLASAFVV
jgi:hypothetical protein